VSKLTVTCDSWRPLKKTTLLGFARIRIAELDLTIHDVAVHRKNDRTWAQLPSKPWIKDGAVILGDNGGPQYSPIFEFTRDEVRYAFSAAVVRTVAERFPDALGLAEDAA
jgi:hypothetical protein